MNAIIDLLCTVLVLAIGVVLLGAGFCWGWVLGSQHERLKRSIPTTQLGGKGHP